MRTQGKIFCLSYQLHPTEFVHQCHISAHDLLQGVIEFT